MAYALRSRIDKWDLIKLQSFCKERTLLIRQKGNQQIGKRSLPINRGLISNIYKELKKLGSRESNNRIKNKVQNETDNVQLWNS